jgi:hypothetical protein
MPIHKKVKRAYGTHILTPPHYKQQKQVMTESQRRLLQRRPKIETVFDYLKEHLHLVTSFLRSVHGYAVHYMRILLGYQLLQMGGSYEIQVYVMIAIPRNRRTEENLVVLFILAPKSNLKYLILQRYLYSILRGSSGWTPSKLLQI